MKRILCALLLLAMMACGASAQTQLDLYVADGAMDALTARRLVQLLQQAMPEAAFALQLEKETGENLRDLVLSDRVPGIALCAPEEAAIWAREGLLLPLEGAIAGAERIAPQVLDACVHEESAFMAPLFARHRLMAVNRQMMEEMELGVMIDARDYPVWLPMQMQQVLEEFALEGEPAMDVWLPEENGEAILALVQAMYCAPLGGESPLLNSGALQAGVAWLEEMVACGLIGVADSREQALSRFLEGETALFCDWTIEEARSLRQESAHFPEVVALPHPSSSGLPVRAFTVTGAAVFQTGDEPRDRLAYDAVAFLSSDARVQEIFGSRAIERDDAVWLPCLGTSVRGASLRSALAEALCAVLNGTMQPHEAVAAAQQAVKALEP